MLPASGHLHTRGHGSRRTAGRPHRQGGTVACPGSGDPRLRGSPGGRRGLAPRSGRRSPPSPSPMSWSSQGSGSPVSGCTPGADRGDARPQRPASAPAEPHRQLRVEPAAPRRRGGHGRQLLDEPVLGLHAESAFARWALVTNIWDTLVKLALPGWRLLARGRRGGLRRRAGPDGARGWRAAAARGARGHTLARGERGAHSVGRAVDWLVRSVGRRPPADGGMPPGRSGCAATAPTSSPPRGRD